MPKGVYKRSEEHNRKLAVGLRKSYDKYYANRPGPMAGKKHTTEVKKKIALASANRVVSESTRTKIGNAHRGKKHTEETKKKLSEAHKKSGHRPPSTKGMKLPTVSGKNSPHWKGDKVKYQGLHAWVRKELGKANLCELKDETCCDKFEWSNISGEYDRDVDDFQQLCISHHRRYDKQRSNQR